MAAEVVWTSKAKISLNGIVQYIFKNFGEIAANKYLYKIERTVSLLGEYPKLGILENVSPNIRCMIIQKRTHLYYSYSKNEIKILNFFDNRQHPDKKLT